MRPLLDREEIARRLNAVFPREAFDTVLSNPLAAAAIAALIYVDAVRPDDGNAPEDEHWARPTTVLWMSDEVYDRDDDASRITWRDAALSGNARKNVGDVHEAWGIPRDVRWYADTTREPIRDETFPQWRSHGAIVMRTSLPSNSSKPRWALAESFADLFDPDLIDIALDDAIEAWRQAHMTTAQRLRIRTVTERASDKHRVAVTLPDGGQRLLEPGDASEILRGVFEQWAPARLTDPVVITISEPGDKVYVLDSARLRDLNITIDPKTLLPDALIADIGAEPITFWAIEVASSDGVIDENRRARLTEWAINQRIPAAQCAFLTAFRDRNSASAKKRLKDLAGGTYAWFLSEPTYELIWREIQNPGGDVIPLRRQPLARPR